MKSIYEGEHLGRYYVDFCFTGKEPYEYWGSEMILVPGSSKTSLHCFCCHTMFSSDYRCPDSMFSSDYRYPDSMLSSVYRLPDSMLSSDYRLPDSMCSVSRDKSTRRTESLIRSWIDDCVDNHISCNRVSGEDRWHQSRLIDLNFQEQTENGKWLRIVDTSLTPVKGSYVTLSHCWGSAECLKLTTSNYTQLLSNFPLSLLPPLYQDAVSVCQAMNVKYLWIDSLCIIQEGDDLADWQHEVSLMGDVYSNALFNIAAASTPDAQHSMFNDRSLDRAFPSVNILVNGCEMTHIIEQKAVWQRSVTSALINSRAWVLQERILSSRIVYFGEQQIFWECCETAATEIHPEGLLPEQHTRDAEFKRIHDSELGYANWEVVVKQYTLCGLTIPSDKLPALSAVAKRFSVILGDEYVAGMWRRNLEGQLLWRRSNFTRAALEAPAVPAYRAPSWSWAAIDGSISPGFPEASISNLWIKITHVSLEYASDDKTGPVRSGKLSLRGPLRRMNLLHGSTKEDQDTSRQEWHLVVSGVNLRTLRQKPAFRAAKFIPQVTLDRFHVDFTQQYAENLLYCMPASGADDKEPTINILLLSLLIKGAICIGVLGSLGHGVMRQGDGS